MIALKNRNITKDLKKIRQFSTLVEKKLSQFDKKNEQIVETLSFEELQDLNQLLQMADYILVKYEDKKEIRFLLKEFVEMINSSAPSMDILNDEINELVVSAENAIARIKNFQNDVSENFSFSEKDNTQIENTNLIPKTSTNNLTNSATPVYTQEYLRKSKVETGQII